MNQNTRKYLIHAGLFILTVVSTTLVGAENVTGKTWWGWGILPESSLLHFSDLPKGLLYSFSFLLFLTVHEFGHYFTALYHQVKATLPYYIPIFIPFPGILNIGSFGAVIRLKQTPDTTGKFFDIGIAGPLAGFVVSVGLIIAGLLTLPDSQYLLNIHPDYLKDYGGVPTQLMQENFIRSYNLAHPDAPQMSYFVGTNLLFELLKYIIPHNAADFPTPFELYHYPLLFVGYLTLFFTALNLLPIGQLDGGHIIYGMFGKKNAGIISRISVVGLILAGGTGLVDLLNLRENYVSLGVYLFFLTFVWNRILNKPDNSWLVFAATVITFLIQAGLKYQFPAIQPNMIWAIYAFMGVRFIGLDHPPALMEHPLSRGRILLGWLAIAIFILTFSPSPVSIFEG
ncbi:MAG: site-2 protease family protein [Bacteroidia bacterium]|nr:site-2 protease family protein [Bacteroidia bacterium]